MAGWFSKKKKGDEPEWDKTFEPLMKVLLSKKGIKTNSASEVGRKKVDYFRGKDFKKFLLGGEAVLQKKCSEALKAVLEGKPPADDKDCDLLGAELLQRNFCVRAQYKPINPGSKDDGAVKPKKWPDRLQRMNNQNFDPEGFYIITYEGGTGLQHFLLALIILGVLLVCLFPVWPMWAKIGVWYLSVIFLFLYFGVLILRMLVFTAFWIVGFDFWIFPNINDEYCGFLDSFQPLYSWEKRKDDPLMLFVRFGSLAITAVAIQQIAETTSMDDFTDFVTHSTQDFIDWGVDKITALPGGESKSTPSLVDLEEEMGNDTNDSNATKWTVNDVMPDEDDDDAETVTVDGAGEEKAETAEEAN